MSTTTTGSAGKVTVAKPTVASHIHDYIGRVRGGDIGSLAAVLGLIVLTLIFGIARPDTFFSQLNFANLFSQGAACCSPTTAGTGPPRSSSRWSPAW
jgi:D-xylose transport system permease protein